MFINLSHTNNFTYVQLGKLEQHLYGNVPPSCSFVV